MKQKSFKCKILLSPPKVFGTMFVLACLVYLTGLSSCKSYKTRVTVKENKAIHQANMELQASPNKAQNLPLDCKSLDYSTGVNASISSSSLSFEEHPSPSDLSLKLIAPPAPDTLRVYVGGSTQKRYLSPEGWCYSAQSHKIFFKSVEQSEFGKTGDDKLINLKHYNLIRASYLSLDYPIVRFSPEHSQKIHRVTEGLYAIEKEVHPNTDILSPVVNLKASSSGLLPPSQKLDRKYWRFERENNAIRLNEFLFTDPDLPFSIEEIQHIEFRYFSRENLNRVLINYEFEKLSVSTDIDLKAFAGDIKTIESIEYLRSNKLKQSAPLGKEHWEFDTESQVLKVSWPIPMVQATSKTELDPDETEGGRVFTPHKPKTKLIITYELVD